MTRRQKIILFGVLRIFHLDAGCREVADSSSSNILCVPFPWWTSKSTMSVFEDNPGCFVFRNPCFQNLKCVASLPCHRSGQPYIAKEAEATCGIALCMVASSEDLAQASMKRRDKAVRSPGGRTTQTALCTFPAQTSSVALSTLPAASMAAYEGTQSFRFEALQACRMRLPSSGHRARGSITAQYGQAWHCTSALVIPELKRVRPTH